MSKVKNEDAVVWPIFWSNETMKVISKIRIVRIDDYYSLTTILQGHYTRHL